MASRRNYTKGQLDFIRRRRDSGASISQDDETALRNAETTGIGASRSGGIASTRRNGRIETPGTKASRVVNGPRRNDPRLSGADRPFRTYGTRREMLDDLEETMSAKSPDSLGAGGTSAPAPAPAPASADKRAFFDQGENLTYHTDSRDPDSDAERTTREQFDRVKNPRTDEIMKGYQDKGVTTRDRTVRVGSRDVKVSGGSFGFSVGSGGSTTPGISRTDNLDVKGNPLYSDQRATERAAAKRQAAESRQAVKEASGDVGMKTIGDAGAKLAVSNMRDEVAGGADAGDVVDRMISRMQDSINKDYARRQVHADAERRRNATPEQRLAGMRGDGEAPGQPNPGPTSGGPSSGAGLIAAATGNQQLQGKSTAEATRAVEKDVQDLVDQTLNSGTAEALGQIGEDERKTRGTMADWGGGVSARARRFLDRRRSEVSTVFNGHLTRARQAYADLGGGQTAGPNAGTAWKPTPVRFVDSPEMSKESARAWLEAFSGGEPAPANKPGPAPKGGDVRYVEKNGNYYRQTYRQGSSEATSGWSGQLVQKSEYDKYQSQLKEGKTAGDADNAVVADIDRKIRLANDTKLWSEDRRAQLEETNRANRAKADAPVTAYHEETGGEYAVRDVKRRAWNVARNLGWVEGRDKSGMPRQNPYSEAPMRRIGTMSQGGRVTLDSPRADQARDAVARGLDVAQRMGERGTSAIAGSWGRFLQSWKDSKGGKSRRSVSYRKPLGGR